MNFLMTYNLERRFICFYCQRVFNSPHPRNFSGGSGSHQSCLIPNGVCQFNTDQDQNFTYGTPALSGNALPCSQNCLGNRHYLVDAVTDVNPGLSSNQLRRFKFNTLDLFPCNSSQCEVGQSEENNGGKRRCSGEAQGNAETVNELKRTKFNLDEMEIGGPHKREDVSNSGLGMPFDVNEDETNLDLSLHL